MSWTTMPGHRPTGPVFYYVHDNEKIPHQKCSCGSWYCVEHVMRVADVARCPDESVDPLF